MIMKATNKRYNISSYTIIAFGVFLFTLTLLVPQITYAAADSVGVHQQVGDVVPEPEPQTGTSGSYDVTAPRIQNVEIKIQTNTVIVSWSSNELAYAKLAWGTTTEYRDGIISTPNLSLTHVQEINSLQENTTYYFLITAIDRFGNQSFYNGQFITGTWPDVMPPLNVTNFTAQAKQNVINLSWVNPADSDFSFTRIVRSTTFFPLDPLNGLVVYEGNAKSFVDRNITPGILYYYTAFTRDLTGNYSSGSLASARIIWYSESFPNNNSANNQNEVPIVDFDFIYSKNIPQTLLSQTDFNFSYDNGKVVLKSNNIYLPATKFLQISISKDTVPKDTMFLLLQYKQWTFLFNENKKNNTYELVLPNNGDLGKHNMTISVFNNNKEIIQDVPMVFYITGEGTETKGLRQIIVDKFSAQILYGVLIVSVLLLGFIFRFIWVRATKKGE